MTNTLNDNTLATVMEYLIQDGTDGMRQVIETLINAAMKIERAQHLKAAPYERLEAREGYANGFKPKTLKTRLGALSLQIPQVRDSSFYPNALEKGCRSERALLSTLSEMYIQGVSTRKVTRVLEELCGLEVSASQVSKVTQQLTESVNQWKNRSIGPMRYLYLDAHYQKIRYGGQVVDLAILIATGVTATGQRSILGVSVSLSEADVHWREFLESLQSRGLSGLELMISDAHAGLKTARRAVFPSVPWQRCQYHLQQNAQSYVSKKSMKEEAGRCIRKIFNASDRTEAERLLKEAVAHYHSSEPALASWMEEALPEGFTHFAFPEHHHKRLRTNNLSERLNREIRRRTKVICIFPNADACERLIGAVLMEISEEWETGKCYLPME